MVGRGPGQGSHRRARLVKNVVIALTLLLVTNADLLQQISLDPCAAQPHLLPDGARERLLPGRGLELQLDELAEAARVVVPQGPRVAESLEHRVRLQHLLLDVRYAAILASSQRKELHDEFRRLGLARAAFATNEDRLRLQAVAHAFVRGPGRVEDVGLRGIRRDETLQNLLVVEPRDRLEWVQGNQNGTGERVDLVDVETVLQRAQHRRLVEVGELCEVVQDRQPFGGVDVRRPKEDRLVGTKRGAAVGRLHGLHNDLLLVGSHNLCLNPHLFLVLHPNEGPLRIMGRHWVTERYAGCLARARFNLPKAALALRA
mmetsp:Transcript_70091/g.194861  ORF Transcript_70091/g.194861 Transcript_70091/m.194861 type:complete len:316 (-) Transcript_70091:19-966(-)